jgi:hypothetical protein
MVGVIREGFVHHSRDCVGRYAGGSVMMLNQSGTLGSTDLGEKVANSIRTRPRFDGSLS